jgi:LDH2 family malate/lactate/ureidoglycolate dehydrogenase
VITDTSALVVLDGRDGIGQVLTAHAVSVGIARAREHGLAGVTGRNFNHFYSKATRDNIAVTVEVVRSDS